MIKSLLVIVLLLTANISFSADLPKTDLNDACGLSGLTLDEACGLNQPFENEGHGISGAFQRQTHQGWIYFFGDINNIRLLEAAVNLQVNIETRTTQSKSLIMFNNIIINELTQYEKLLVKHDVDRILSKIKMRDLLIRGPLWMRKGRHQ
jgi:hypothetical protein